MCGVFGLFGFGASGCDSVSVDDPRLLAMERALRHRGPDGAARAAAGRGVLGSTRLRIVGAGDSGQQPLADESGLSLLACNGEFFDHAALRAGLEKRGHRFRSDTDVEVALHIYEEAGLAGIGGLSGMFAFALHDASRGELHLARDRFGEKPLFLRRAAGRIAFASEIPALLAAFAPERPGIDLDAVREYAAFQSVGGARTLVSGIEKIEPGFALTFDLASGAERRARIAPPIEPGDGTNAGLLAALRRAVERRVAGLSARVGVALSGGLDSSAVAALAARAPAEPGRDLVLVTGYCDEVPGFDERPFAREVARSVGSPLVEARLDEETFAAALPDAIRALGEPAAGPGAVGQLVVARAAAREGVRVLLTGEGSDELFGGYARFLLAWQRESGRRVDASPLGDYGALEAAFAAAPSALDGYLGALARDPSSAAVKSARLEIEARKGPLLARLLAFETERLLPALLAVDDRVTMAAGIESRSPFLDAGVAAAAAGFGAEALFAGGLPKAPLREAMRGLLPEGVRLRPDKMGFPVPLGRYLARSLEAPLRRAAEAVSDLALPVDARLPGKGEPIGRAEARRLWGVLSLGLWAALW